MVNQRESILRMQEVFELIIKKIYNQTPRSLLRKVLFPGLNVEVLMTVLRLYHNIANLDIMENA